MKRSGLPKEWERWRRRRYQRLYASGLAGRLAWPIASGEAKWRSRLSYVIGPDRAREARVTCVGEGSSLRFVLSGAISGLSDAQLSAIEQLNCRATSAA
jgi:hypothetical protein